MPAKDDFILPSGEKRIHRGNDFDDLIQQAMDLSSHHDDEFLDSAENDIGHNKDDNDDKDNVESGSLSDDSKGDSSDSDGSLESDDLSMVDDNSDKDVDGDSYVPNVPLVDDFESVMEMKHPAPMGQSVSSYVDHLNQRGRGKSTMIKAGVFAILIAVVVGVTLSVLSMTDSKDVSVDDDNLVLQSSGDSQVETPGEEIIIDNLFHSVEITINGALYLSGLVIPVGGLERVKDIFEMVIAETVSISLELNQTVLNVSVAKISTKVKEDQAVSIVNYKVVVEEKCRDCSQKEGMEEALHQHVLSDTIEAIKTGYFTDNLHKRARIQGNNILLSAIVIDGEVEGHAATLTQPSYEFPTQQPSPKRIPEIMMTLSPSPPPTPPPRPIPTLATSYPVTEAVTELIRTPPPTPAPTPLLTISPITSAPMTRAPFPLPLVEFAPTDPPSDMPTKRPTQLPTNRPSPSPTPRTLRPSTRYVISHGFPAKFVLRFFRLKSVPNDFILC